jgi:YgiT-type zinc finger domain-containing protein
MDCFLCKGKLEDKVSAFMAELDSCIVIVKNVPSQVCGQCGEVSYSDEVVRQLEKIVETVKTASLNTLVSTEIAVVNYSLPAA